MRLFLALPLSYDWLKTFEHYRDAHSDIRYLRWMPLENLHVTALFLGEVMDATLPHVIERAEEIAHATHTFMLDFQRIQYAPPETRAHMVWAYLDASPLYVRMVQELSDSFSEIFVGHEDIKSSLLSGGIDIAPHVTFARFRSDRPHPRELHKLHRTEREGESLAFRELRLYRSRLRSERPTYDVIDTFALKD